MSYHVKFWGTRGSLPVNSPTHRKYGGNTSCIALTNAKTPSVIFDGGSGLRSLGNELTTQNIKEIDIIFSHFHADHICGLPFFKPLFNPTCHVRLHCFALAHQTHNTNHMRDILKQYIRPPAFPITCDDFRARVSYLTHDENKRINFNDAYVDALAIPHPGGAHALRFKTQETSLVYATDTEHIPDRPNQNLIDFARNATMMIYDCTYDDDEFDAHIGWGHSTWQEGLRLAQAANVKRFAIFHHDPDRSDAALEIIAKKARKIMNDSFVAQDGQIIIL